MIQGSIKRVTSMSENVWIKDFQPIVNHLDPDAGWAGFDSENDDSGCLFETYGEEEAYILSLDPHKVWTLIEADGKEYIENGRHFVNRLGYFVTRTPWVEGQDISIRVG